MELKDSLRIVENFQCVYFYFISLSHSMIIHEANFPNIAPEINMSITHGWRSLQARRINQDESQVVTQIDHWNWFSAWKRLANDKRYLWSDRYVWFGTSLTNPRPCFRSLVTSIESWQPLQGQVQWQDARNSCSILWIMAFWHVPQPSFI